MTITRANLEAELISRIGAWMVAASLDGTTVSGANTALNSAIRYGIVTAGGTVSNPALVTDADVATVASADLDLLYDAAELRALQNTLGNFALVDTRAGPVEAKMSQLADLIERRIGYLRGWIATTYSIGGYAAFSVTLTRTDGYSELAALDL